MYDQPMDHSNGPETLDVVRSKVKSLLTSSPAFRALPKARQQQIAHDTVKAATYMADAGGVNSKTPMSAVIENPAQGQLAVARTTAQSAPGQDPFADAGDQFTPAATKEAADILGGMVDAVDFPNFVGGLIEGVFNAIVDASIQQMDAYGAMVANVAKTVDQYMQDNVSPAQAQDQLVSGNPELFQANTSGDGHVEKRDDADENQMAGFLQSLGLPFDLDVDDPEAVQTQVVPAVRKSMAMDRQKLLATMVLMGINRIVVTDGTIRASVKFDISATDNVNRAQEIADSFEHKYNSKYKKKKKNGWWIFSNSNETRKTNVKITTTSDRTQTDESESKIKLKTTMTGNVDLRFKSETFPLEKMMDMLGTNETVIQMQATQATTQQGQQVQAPPLPQAPDLPPPPAGFAPGAA